MTTVYEVINDGDDDVNVSDINVTVHGKSSLRLLDHVSLPDVRRSDNLIQLICSKRVVLKREGRVLQPPQAISSLFGAFIVRNTGSTPIQVKDIGVTIAPSGTSDLSLIPITKLRDSRLLAQNITSGALVASDGTNEMSVSRALRYLYGLPGISETDIIGKLKVIETTDFLGNLCIVSLYLDEIRGQWLSIDKQVFAFSKKVVQHLDWIRPNGGPQQDYRTATFGGVLSAVTVRGDGDSFTIKVRVNDVETVLTDVVPFMSQDISIGVPIGAHIRVRAYGESGYVLRNVTVDLTFQHTG